MKRLAIDAESAFRQWRVSTHVQRRGKISTHQCAFSSLLNTNVAAPAFGELGLQATATRDGRTRACWIALSKYWPVYV